MIAYEDFHNQNKISLGKIDFENYIIYKFLRGPKKNSIWVLTKYGKFWGEFFWIPISQIAHISVPKKPFIEINTGLKKEIDNGFEVHAFHREDTEDAVKFLKENL